MIGKSIWVFILRLFGKERTPTEGAVQENGIFAAGYRDVERINFTAIFASKLSTLALCGSTVDVVGRGKRATLLDQCAAEVWLQMKKISSGMLGMGGCALVPYVQEGKILFDMVPQERIVISKRIGERITSATILADQRKEGARVYYRWVDYTVKDNMLYITNRVTDGDGRVCFYEGWSEIADHIIGGVDRVLFSFLRSPIDQRGGMTDYGVPITYGCDSLIQEIHQCLDEIREEFQLKQVRIFADERLFKRDEVTGRRLMPSKAFVSGNLEASSSMMEVFSPELRHSSYYARLLELFTLLERAVGTSRGVLTTPESRGATATEIKAGLYDTFAMVSDIRGVIEAGIREYLRACEVLINYYNLAPLGEHQVVFDWDYSLVESSQESWAQMKEAVALGLRSKGEARQWLCPDETLAEAEAKIHTMKEVEIATEMTLAQRELKLKEQETK